MKELFRRLFSHPVLAAEILAATLMTTLFNLAMPIYVMQLLNRYVNYGFHGTLITLTAGMLIAVCLQFGFRLIRNRMAEAVNQGFNDQLSQEMLTLISRAKAAPLSQISKPKIQEGLTHVQAIQQSYDAQTLISLLDAPFSLILIGFIYLLSPLLAAICLTGIGVAILLGWLTILRSKKTGDQLTQVTSEHRGLNFSAVNSLETVRAFCALPFLNEKWRGQLQNASRLKSRLSGIKEMTQTLTMSGSAFTSMFLYAAGAVLVVQGELSVGALIGANILSGRAYQSTTRLVQAIFALNRAKEAFAHLSIFRQIPLESSTGTALKAYKGKIECHDLGFAYPNAPTPVFETLNLTLEPGTVLGVIGDNGTGKTTLAKLFVTLLDPRRGTIMADGVNLQQLAPEWWRRQIIYMPQEPEFIFGTLRENILLLNPDLDDAGVNEILKQADLRSFLDKTPQGLDTRITDSQRNFPPGIRRRISLARALAGGGQLAILDEPTDGLDKKGVEAVYQVMNHLAKGDKTIIVFSNDPNILKGTGMILNLNKKPVPELIHNPKNPSRHEALLMEPNPIKSSTHLFFLLLVAMCAAFGVWTYYGTLDVVSMAQGEVVPSGRVKQVQHFEGGIIREIKVKEGQEVDRGEPLVALERLRTVASHEELKMRIDALRVDVIRLKAQADGHDALEFPPQMETEFPRLTVEARELFRARRESHQSTMNKLDTMIRQKEQRIKTIEAQLQNKLERLPLMEEEKALSEELLKDNLTTRIKHIDILKRLKETEGKIANDRNSLKEARHALIETREKSNEARNKFREETAEELKKAHQDLNEFSVRLKKFKDSLERTIIRSPIHGVVKKLYRVTRGGVLKPGDILADIVPLEERLVIEAHLAISDIGYIKKGQKAYLQLPSTDAKKFKKLQGKVITISPDTFTDPQGQTFYNVRIESEQSYFEAGTQKYRLYPGMVLVAYIHIGNRTILDYLVDPFVNTLSFSMQER